MLDPTALAWALAQAQGTMWRDLAMAIASGATSVRFADGRNVEYRSLAEIERILAAGYATSVDPNVNPRRPSVTYASFCRGDA